MHLYVHIPFCHRICPYCAFFKHTPASTDMKSFIRALGREAESRATALATNREGATHAADLDLTVKTRPVGQAEKSGRSGGHDNNRLRG